MQKQMSRINQVVRSFEGRPIASDVLSAIALSVHDCLMEAVSKNQKMLKTHHGRAALMRRERKEQMRLWFLVKHRFPNRCSKRFYPRVLRVADHLAWSEWFEE